MKSFDTGLERESLICARCGYCQAVCPVFETLGWESTGPRGRMLIARAAAQGHVLSPHQAQRVYQCTLCGHCREVCSTRIDTVSIWAELRKRLAEQGHLSDRPLAALRDNLLAAGNITGDAAENRLLWQENLEPTQSFSSQLAGIEVVYFVGCVASLYPQVSAIPASLASLLRRADISFTTLGSGEKCCGFPLIAMGLPDEARRLAQENLNLVRALGARTLVMTCPTCYRTWKRVYPELLGEPLGVEVLHATEELVRLVKERRLVFKPVEGRVTYHDPCDLGRNGGLYDPPRLLIEAAPSVELVEMADSRGDAQCCGGGGNLESVDPELAAAIADRRLVQALDTGASTLITACQQCRRTLAAAARRQRVRLKVVDVVEFLAK